MGIARMRSIGWRTRAEISDGMSALKTPWRRLSAVLAIAPGTCLVVMLVWIGLTDGPGVEALLNRFAAIHVFLGAGATALALYGCLSLVSGIGSVILTIAEAVPQVALGGAMMTALPFAQIAEPGNPTSPPGDTTSAARSEMQLGLYMGGSKSPPSDVRMVSPDGTDLVLKNVVWKTESFKPSPYYGGRGIDWSARFPNFGMMVDFTHAKATAIRSQTVEQAGMRSGVEIPPKEAFDKTFRKLEFTHGLNFLTFNGVFRVTGLHRRMIPYAGLGVGFMVPHVEAWRAGLKKKDAVHEAQVTGMALQALGGIEWRIFKSDRRSLFTEYKVTHTSNDVKLHQGGSVSTDILVHQFIFGGYFTPWRQGAAATK